MVPIWGAIHRLDLWKKQPLFTNVKVCDSKMSRGSPGTHCLAGPPFLYYSRTTPIRLAWSTGMVWEAYEKGFPLLGVPWRNPIEQQKTQQRAENNVFFCKKDYLMLQNIGSYFCFPSKFIRSFPHPTPPGSEVSSQAETAEQLLPGSVHSTGEVSSEQWPKRQNVCCI